jgi:MFS transporter, UMF1 family
VVFLLGLEINTASFAMYTFSVSVLLQALLVVSISSAADHGNYRKKLLLTFAWIGAASVMCFIFVSKEVYVLGALLTIISNTTFGASFVLLNSFLPLLVRHHPRVEKLETDSIAVVSAAEERNEMPVGHELTRTPTHAEVTSAELSLSTEISARGVGIGYSAGLFVQCMSILVLIAMKNSTWSQRVVLLFIGSWWAVFTIPAAMWLRPRPGPPLEAGTDQKGARAWLAYMFYAWKSLFRTIRLARRLLDITLFLVAWFLLSDAVATTSSTAILFAKTQLHMKPAALGMINVISTTAGVTGAFAWPFISKVFGLRPHQTIIACIAIFELIPLYGLLGYLPFVQDWGVVGLQQAWEMYPLAALYGFVLGGIGGYCRSLYGQLIPPGSEAAFYALYAITDKGSSVFGPTIVGAIIDASGEIRPAFWFLAALVGLPALPIWYVNADRGKAEGEKLAKIIEGYKVRHAEGAAEGGDGDEGAREGMLAAYEREDSGEETERAVPQP